MIIPKISMSTARNIALSTLIFTVAACATPCNCKNYSDSFTKEKNDITKINNSQNTEENSYLL